MKNTAHPSLQQKPWCIHSRWMPSKSTRSHPLLWQENVLLWPPLIHCHRLPNYTTAWSLLGQDSVAVPTVSSSMWLMCPRTACQELGEVFTKLQTHHCQCPGDINNVLCSVMAIHNSTSCNNSRPSSNQYKTTRASALASVWYLSPLVV